MIALAATTVLGTVGGALLGTGHPVKSHGWFVGAAATFAVALFVALAYFVIHPAIEALDNKRSTWLNAIRAARPEPILKARSRPTQSTMPIQPAELLIPEGAIVKAEYGAEHSWADVIGIVRKAQGYGDSLMVTNDTMGGDPIVNTPKVLRLTYENGALVEVNEGDTHPFS